MGVTSASLALVAEQAIVLVAGLAMGTLISAGVLVWARHLGLGSQTDLTVRTFAYGAVASTVASMVGLLVAIRDLATLSVAGGRFTTATDTKQVIRVRDGLLVAQIAICFASTAGAWVLGQTFRHFADVDTGFDAEHVITVKFADRAGSTVDSKRLTYDALKEKAEALAFVRSASVVGTIPMMDRAIVPIAASDGTGGALAGLRVVDNDYLRSIGTRLVSGRFFGPTDQASSAPVAVLSDQLARALWPGGNAIGKCVHFGSGPQGCVTVVGIVRDMRDVDVREAPMPTLYLPHDQRKFGAAGGMVVRVSGEPHAELSRLRRALEHAQDGLPFLAIEPLTARVEEQLGPWKVGFDGLALVSVLVTLLAGLGLYGVAALHVVRRYREMAIRMAVGATPMSVARSLVSYVGKCTCGGIVIGVAISPFVFHLLVASLPEVILGGLGPYLSGLAITSAVAAAGLTVPIGRIMPIDIASLMKE